MGNVSLERKKDLSTFRRIAIGTWATPHEAQVYGTLEVRMDRAMRYIERYRRMTGKRLTVTHMVARAAAAAMTEMPDANAMLRWNHIYLRKHIDIFLQVVMTDQGDDKVDLSGMTVRDIDKKNLSEIVDEMDQRLEKIRSRKDSELEKTRGTFNWIPQIFIGYVLRLISFLTYTLNLRLPGMPRDPFGSLMITNIGSLGLEIGYVPLVPYSRVPMILAMGAVREVPLAEEGRVVIGQVMKINATFDHRFIDGYHAAVMSRTLRTWLEAPEKYFEKLPTEEAEPNTDRLPLTA
jgi:pyruvate dehydrogenase E2 component (dihydrolipoamide acetyltransferase)